MSQILSIGLLIVSVALLVLHFSDIKKSRKINE